MERSWKKSKSFLDKDFIHTTTKQKYLDLHTKVSKGAKEAETIVRLNSRFSTEDSFYVKYTTQFNEKGEPYKAIGTAHKLPGYNELEENSVCSFFEHTAEDGKKYNVYSILLTLDVDLVIPQKNIVTSVAIDPNHKNFLMCADSNGNTFEVKNLSIIKYFFHMTDHMRSLISKTKKGSKRHIYLSKALNRICFKREEQIKKILYKIAHYLTDK